LLARHVAGDPNIELYYPDVIKACALDGKPNGTLVDVVILARRVATGYYPKFCIY